MRLAIYERAVELDDDQPDDVCPGCLRHIGEMPPWAEAHYAVGTTSRGKGSRIWIDGFGGDVDMARLCPWTRLYLYARQFRRAYIARWRAARPEAVPA